MQRLSYCVARFGSGVLHCGLQTHRGSTQLLVYSRFWSDVDILEGGSFGWTVFIPAVHFQRCVEAMPRHVQDVLVAQTPCYNPWCWFFNLFIFSFSFLIWHPSVAYGSVWVQIKALKPTKTPWSVSERRRSEGSPWTCSKTTSTPVWDVRRFFWIC